MSTRRLLPLGVVVIVLLGLVGIASHGRPLAGGRGGGPTATFFDYVLTTVLIVSFATVAIFAYLLLSERDGGRLRPNRRSSLLSMMIGLAASMLLAALILHTHFERRLQHLDVSPGIPRQPPRHAGRPLQRTTLHPRVRWDEIAVVVVLLAGTAAVLVASRNARGRPRPLRSRRSAAVTAALDESIDDLRSDPDLRRAIVAAYARMERALAAAGLPRRASEAPFEYLERALVELDTSAESVRRLTALFEWAKFSHHEPDSAMRDEAVDALVAVRNELRAPAREAVHA